MKELQPEPSITTYGESREALVRVPACQLRDLIEMAKQYTEDVKSGLAEGLYDMSENFDIDSNLGIVQSAENWLSEGLQLIDTDKAIRSVQLRELVGDVVLLKDIPEFCWVAQNASFTHCRNAQIGVWEFILDLNITFRDIPPLLLLEIQTAREEGVSYLHFQQG